MQGGCLKHLVSFGRNETEKNVTNDGENFGDCSDAVDCTNVNNEVAQPGSISEGEEKDQVMSSTEAMCWRLCALEHCSL